MLKKTQILWNSLWSSDQTSRRFLKSEWWEKPHVKSRYWFIFLLLTNRTDNSLTECPCLQLTLIRCLQLYLITIFEGCCFHVNWHTVCSLFKDKRKGVSGCLDAAIEVMLPFPPLSLFTSTLFLINSSFPSSPQVLWITTKGYRPPNNVFIYIYFCPSHV